MQEAAMIANVPGLGARHHPTGEAIWWPSVLLMFALSVPTLVAMAIDERTLFGISVWIKPLKFQLSAAVHLATLALVASLLVEPIRRGRLVGWTAIAACATAMFEVVYITAQAARGRTSHFNEATVVESVMYSLMGIFAVLLTLTALVMALLVWRDARPETGAGLRLGATLGLGFGCIATLVVAGYLGGQDGHWVGGIPTDANGLPLTHWATDGGDLRVPHFFALHMMQTVPFAGWLADRTIGFGRSVALLATAACLAITAFTFHQAMAGRPFLAL
jgi:hypothetical protein